MAKIAREAAEREQVTPRTIRNRLLAVNHALGGGLVRSFEKSGPVRKWWVNLGKLEEALRTTPETRSAAELEWHESRIEKLEQSNAAIKKAIRQLKKQLAMAGVLAAQRQDSEKDSADEPPT